MIATSHPENQNEIAEQARAIPESILVSLKNTVKQKSAPSQNSQKSESASLRLYFKEISRIPLLTEAEEIRLIARAQNGDQEAASELISSNLRFVVKVAKQFQHRSLPLSDLISEGNLGLIRALETFDASKGTRFITYAVWWIKQSIFQAIYSKSRMVRVPQKKQNSALRHLRALDQANELLNSGQKELGLRHDSVAGKEPHGFPSDYLLPHHSLQAPMDQDSSNSLIDIIADENTICPEKEVSTQNLRRDLKATLRVLNEQERRCLELIYAFSGEPPLTVDEVAQRLSLSRSSVKQLRERAIAKLRKNSHVTAKLGEYLDELS